MNTLDALRLLNAGMSAEWNAYRHEHPDWVPDLHGQDLSLVDFVPLHGPAFDMTRANLCGTRLPEPGRFAYDSRKVNLTNAIFDFSVEFAAEVVPLTDFGATLVVESENGPQKVRPLRLFISYAHADEARVSPVVSWLQSHKLDVRQDHRAFLPGLQLDDEIRRVMADCHAAVVFWSTQSREREWVQFERELASTLERDANAAGRPAPALIYVLLDETQLPESDSLRIAINAQHRPAEWVGAEIVRGILERPRLLAVAGRPVVPGATDGKALRKRIAAYMRWLRNQMPRDIVDPTQPKAFESWADTIDDRETKRFIIYLRSSGCRWAISTAGAEPRLLAGCLDCEHSLAGSTFGAPVSTADYVAQFEQAIRRVDFSLHPVVCIYNEGNFFNEAELPAEARQTILRRLAGFPEVRSVIVESLPEYLNKAVLSEMREILGDHRTIEIGIGLESSNETVRSLCVNKSYSLADFDAAIATVTPYAKVLAYVLLKPSFLSEAEALKDAVDTCRYAFDRGVDIVSIEPVNISRFNMSGALNRIDMYRPCWLWTIVEVVLQASKWGHVRIGGEQFAPKYPHHPLNCHRCSMRFYLAFQRFNATLDTGVLAALECSCRERWLDELERQDAAFTDRVERALVRLEASTTNSH